VQTFLPYSRFDSSAAVLDDLRLGKQRVETLQILRALVYPSYRGWKNHPATAMWRGFTDALVAYGVAICAEWTRRGRADAVRPALLEFAGGVEVGQDELHRRGRLPPWLGLPAFHAAHRGALLSKLPEHYRARFPDGDAELPYVWPRPLFPRWPIRRAGPMSARAAAAALGVTDTDTWPAAFAVLRAPGPTLWLHDRPCEPAPAAVSLQPPTTPRRAGTVAPSVARPPTRADLVSVAAEVATPPLLQVYRVTDLRKASVRDALREPALVVLEGLPRTSAIRRRFPGAALLEIERDEIEREEV